MKGERQEESCDVRAAVTKVPKPFIMFSSTRSLTKSPLATPNPNATSTSDQNLLSDDQTDNTTICLAHIAPNPYVHYHNALFECVQQRDDEAFLFAGVKLVDEDKMQETSLDVEDPCDMEAFSDRRMTRSLHTLGLEGRDEDNVRHSPNALTHHDNSLHARIQRQKLEMRNRKRKSMDDSTSTRAKLTKVHLNGIKCLQRISTAMVLVEPHQLIVFGGKYKHLLNDCHIIDLSDKRMYPVIIRESLETEPERRAREAAIERQLYLQKWKHDRLHKPTIEEAFERLTRAATPTGEIYRIPPIRDHKAFYDKGDRVVYSFYGRHQNGETNAVYKLQWRCIDDGSYIGVWTNATRGGEAPCARFGHAMCFSGDRTVLLFGGQDSKGHCFNDLWFFNFETNLWRKEEAAAPPRSRSYAAILSLHSEILLFGGRTSDGKMLNDMFRLRPATGVCIWEPILLRGTVPRGRMCCALVGNGIHNVHKGTDNEVYRILLLGGLEEKNSVVQTYQFEFPRVKVTFCANLQGRLSANLVNRLFTDVVVVCYETMTMRRLGRAASDTQS